MEEEIEKQYQWCPIHFSGKSRQEISPEGRHYMSGEYDGVRWHVDLDGENAMWVVTATDGKREYEERMEWVHEPVFGIDVTDAERTEEAICRLVSKCKSNKFVRFKDWFMNKFKRK